MSDVGASKSSYKIIAYNALALPDSYKPMIYSKWLRSLRYGNDYFKLIDSNSFYVNYHKYLESILSRQETIIRMAVLSDDYDVVLGFSVCRPNVLDYVHVHRDYRRKGIGGSLLPFHDAIGWISHVTRDGMSFWNNRLKEAKFNPFI